MKNTFLLTCFFCVAIIDVYAQESDTKNQISDYSNELGNTKNSKTIPKGKIFSTLGYLAGNETTTRYDWLEELEYQAATFDLGFGLGKRWDIRVNSHYFSLNRSNNNWSYESKGLSHLKFSSTYNFLKQKGYLPEMSALISYSFNSGFHRYGALGELYGDQISIGLPWAYKFGPNFRFGGAFEYNASNYQGDVMMISLNGRYNTNYGLGFFADCKYDFMISRLGSGVYSLNPSLGVFYSINNTMLLSLGYEKKYYTRVMYDSWNYNSNQITLGFSYLFFNN